MFDQAHLRALAAVLNEGSFDAAAARLNITPSAVSQRIRALEEVAGGTLLIRSQPVEATEAGQILYQHAETIALLEQDLSQHFRPDTGTDRPRRARIAVNADSLDTWFIPAMARAQEDSDLLFDVTSVDQDHTLSRLRAGKVQAAITAENQPVAGCDVTHLGALRYVATCSPEFAQHWFPEGVTAESLQNAPALVFDRQDRLQNLWVQRECGRPLVLRRQHMLPSTKGFVSAAEAGLGWGMNPENLVRDKIKDGSLVALGWRPEYDTPLYWQVSRIVAGPLRPLTRAVVKLARESLVQNQNTGKLEN
ncbi:LysR family transcriptional regulator ArgP [Halocynthiibacter styelae]|nr:LysR family transcriptional regulator ArgP [Paenihalocynthiibacter styelae]